MITPVSSHEQASTNSNGFTTTAIDTTGADFLIVFVSSYVGAAAPTVSDSKGNSWNALTASTGSEIRGQLYYAINPTVGSGHTFTISGTGNYAAMTVQAFSGVHLTAPFDQQAGANGTGTTLQPGSVTPGENNELLYTGVGGWVDAFGSGTPTINSGFTMEGHVPVNSGNSYGAGHGYLIQTTAGAANPTWGNLVNGNDKATRIATFKAGGGPTGNPWYAYQNQQLVRG